MREMQTAGAYTESYKMGINNIISDLTVTMNRIQELFSSQPEAQQAIFSISSANNLLNAADSAINNAMNGMNTLISSASK